MRVLTVVLRPAHRYSDTPRRPWRFRSLHVRRRSTGRLVRRRSPGWAIDQRLRECDVAAMYPRLY